MLLLLAIFEKITPHVVKSISKYLKRHGWRVKTASFLIKLCKLLTLSVYRDFYPKNVTIVLIKNYLSTHRVYSQSTLILGTMWLFDDFEKQQSAGIGALLFLPI